VKIAIESCCTERNVPAGEAQIRTIRVSDPAGRERRMMEFDTETGLLVIVEGTKTVIVPRENVDWMIPLAQPKPAYSKK
jgi:hypothetical protein